jgi:hypothetical protein
VRQLLLVLVMAGVAAGQVAVMPLAQVRAGMRGVGRTVFQGSAVEEFQVEILGVMQNTGPRQSMILARLSGGPLANVGVMQGMSGSPVYIDGRLVGAVATAFSFAKEPIAGIRPIEDMLALPAPGPVQRAGKMPAWSPDGSHLAAAFERPAGAVGKLTNIAAPLSFSGFPAATIERFAPQFRALGVEPRQGATAGGNGGFAPGDTRRVTPGSMISAHLITGDFIMGADGTVTHVEGNDVYAFGHEFLQVGAVEIPFWRSEVMALLASQEVSFKISASREFMGTLTGDYETGIRGVLGRVPSMLPVEIAVDGRPAYSLAVVRDTLLSPFFLQVATAAAVDGTERSAGEGTARVTGEIQFANGAAPVKIDNTYAADTHVAGLASLAAAVPLSFVMQAGYAELVPERVKLDIRTAGQKNELIVDDLWASRSKVRPGETVEFVVELRGDGAQEMIRRVSYQVPLGMPKGPLQVSVHDAQTANVLDYAQTVNQPPHSATQAVEFLNALRPNHQAFLRVVRPEASFPVGHRQLADPPPSVALLLNRWPGSASAPLPQAKVAEFAIDGGGNQIGGTRTIQIEVVE